MNIVLRTRGFFHTTLKTLILKMILSLLKKKRTDVFEENHQNNRLGNQFEWEKKNVK